MSILVWINRYISFPSHFTFWSFGKIFEVLADIQQEPGTQMTVALVVPLDWFASAREDVLLNIKNVISSESDSSLQGHDIFLYFHLTSTKTPRIVCLSLR